MDSEKVWYALNIRQKGERSRDHSNNIGRFNDFAPADAYARYLQSQGTGAELVEYRTAMPAGPGRTRLFNRWTYQLDGKVRLNGKVL